MTFLKSMLLTALAFISISATVLISSCEKDSCSNLTCQNGGACSSGFCHCTSGYEGAECEILTAQRFYGLYIGSKKCDSASGLLDTISVFSGNNGDKTQVTLVNSFNANEAIRGNVSVSGGQYLILVPDQTVNGNTVNKFTVSLNNNTLNFFTNTVTNGTSKSTCTFIGKK
jgi:hypothetical protein